MDNQKRKPGERTCTGSTAYDCSVAGLRNYLSFGGGVNSVALYLLMEQLGMDFEAIFVDHGGDYPETYEYVDYFISTGRPITILRPEHKIKKTGETFDSLYEYCWSRKTVPSTMMRWCTDKFKVTPVHRYIKKPCWMHLGIDAGEQKRAKMSVTNGIESRWLLIEHGIDRQGCKDMIAKAGLKVPPKSGCFFCPFQRIAQWRELRMKHPNLFCKAQKLEKRKMDAPSINGAKRFSLRNDGRTLDKIINTAPHLWPEMDYPPCQCGL